MGVAVQSFNSRLPWNPDPAIERRFANILLAVLLPIAAFSMLIPVLPTIDLDLPEQTLQPTTVRLVELVIKQHQPPPPPEPVERPKPEPKPKPQPKPEPKPAPEPNPQPKPAPAPTQQPQGKQGGSSGPKAEESGIMAALGALQDLQQNTTAASIRSQRDLSQAVEDVRRGRNLITTNLGQGATVDVPTETGAQTLGYGTELAGRTTTQLGGGTGSGGGIGNGIGSGTAIAGSSGRGVGGGMATRSLKSIQLVFDQHKSSLFALYQRALRRHPGMQGTVVIRLEIQPSGRVSSAAIESSGLNNDALEAKILNRVRIMNFGAQDVPVWRDTYRIQFFPG